MVQTKIVQYNRPSGYMAGSICALLGKSPVTWPMPVVNNALFHSADSALAVTGGDSRKGNTAPIANVNNSGSTSFSVFPNPTYGILAATTTGSGIFYLYTIEGQLISQYTL